MIKPEELRIGSCILIQDRKKEGIPCITTRVTQILHNEVKTEYHKYTDSCLCINPIPITEDVLLKCGFVKSDSETAVYFNYGPSLLISFPKDDNNFLVSYNGAFYHHVKNVHQLQNIYFALTDKELNIQL